MDETLPDPLPYSQEAPPLAMSSPQVNTCRNTVAGASCSTPINKGSRWRPTRCGILEEEEDMPLTSSQTTSIFNKITQNCNEFELVWSSPTRERQPAASVTTRPQINAFSLSRNKSFRPKSTKQSSSHKAQAKDPPKDTIKIKPILLPVCVDLDNSMDCSSTDNDLMFIAQQNTVRNESGGGPSNSSDRPKINIDVDVENLFLDDSSFDFEMLKCSQEVEEMLLNNNNKRDQLMTPQRPANKADGTPNRLSKILANFEDSMDDDCLSSLPIDDLVRESTSFSRHNSMPVTPGRGDVNAPSSRSFGRHSSMPHQNSVFHASAGSSSGASSCSESNGPTHSQKRICTQQEIALKRQQALQRLKANKRKLTVRSTSNGNFSSGSGNQR